MKSNVSRFRVRDLFSEAISGILQRPSRSALTALGTVLGIGSFVAILGLTETASAQISRHFSLLDATTVNVEDLAPELAGGPALGFPENATERIEALHGVVAAGVMWKVPLINEEVSVRPGTGIDSAQLDVYAASPGLLRAIEPRLSAGSLFNDFHTGSHQPVVVLGGAAARQLGINRVDGRSAIFLGSDPYTVVGILEATERRPELMLSVIIPDTTALARYGPPAQASPASMLIETDLGAATLIARQAPVALRPDDPGTLHAISPPDPRTLRDSVTTDINGLFLALAAVAVVVGALGIANTTLVSILERTPEIGLRRALGARPRHITAQFLTESSLIGATGGLVGAATGVLSILLVSLVQRWTVILNPINVLPGPIAGALIGLVAGLYPALRASRIEPARAMRH